MKFLILPLMLTSLGALASQNPSLEAVQSYCHKTSIPLLQAALDSVEHDVGKQASTQWDNISSTVYNNENYKSAPEEVKKTMKDTLENVILSKKIKNDFIDDYIAHGQKDREILAALWAQHSVEPYLIKCGYMKYNN